MSKANQKAREFENADAGSLSVGGLLTALIVVVVGLALIPTITDSTNSSVNALGADSAGGNLAELIPLFFVLIIVGGVVAFVVFRD